MDFTFIISGAPRLKEDELSGYCRDLIEATQVTDVDICDILRMRDNGQYPWIIKCTVSSKEKRNEITRNSSLLKETDRFSGVYIRNSQTEAVRIQRANNITLLKELNVDQTLRINNKGRLIRKTARRETSVHTPEQQPHPAQPDDHTRQQPTEGQRSPLPGGARAPRPMLASPASSVSADMGSADVRQKTN